ncbi:hypothetical protein C2S51_024999 [Perilla frutescens var. frutescens]|nr:hypothetical protein C2S51_024999 [Perilla frutescens var. frutescens]
MDHWQSVIVQYGGRWQNSDYEGGDEQLVHIPAQPISLGELIQRINYIMRSNSLGADYLLYYLLRTRNGRLLRYLLSTDQDLQGLCIREGEPTVVTRSMPTTTSNHEPVGSHEYAGDFGGNGEEDDAGGNPSQNIHEFAAWIHREGGVNKLLSMLGISNPSPIPEESNPTEELNENWLIPMIPIDVSDSLLISDLEGVPDDQLCKGSTFWTKDALSIAVGLWNIHHRAEYKAARSDSKRLIIVCKHEDRCPFEIMKPKDIRAKMLEEFGIRTSYSVALRARNAAIEMIYGRHEDFFKMLPSYLYMLEQANPSTFTDLEVGPDNQFQHVVRLAFGCNPETLIVSDAHISISNAVQEVFPGTPHGLCYYHLLNKFTRYDKGVTSMFYKAAYNYHRTAYDKVMAAIHALSPNGAYTKLMDIGPERWARSKCLVRRYGFLTSNAAKVLNARLLWARRLPICSLIKCIRHKSCKCREFQLDLMPCSHAVAAIMKNGESILDYVSSYYTMDNWRETYEGSVRSLPHQDEWVVPAHIAQQKVTPLIVTRQAGRPPGRRHPSGAEAANRRRQGPRKYNICRDPNHTRNNCPNRDR